jgi:hypothetical protein
MSLIFGHLIYTSFPQGGLRLLTSEGVSPDIREIFIDRMTRHWIAQGPPKPGYRCAYIHQIAAEKTLLGWIYNDAIEEDARKGHVPYFIGYFLMGRLNPAKLKNIFALLEQGPPSDIDRQNPPEHLEPVVAPDLWDYQPKRPGVAPPPQIYERSCRTLEKGGLIDYLPFIYAPATDLPLMNPQKQVQQPSASVANNLGQFSRNLQNTFQDLPWKPLLGVAAVCVAAITISLSFIFSPASTSDLTAPNFNESKDTAYATNGDVHSQFSPEAITEQSLESARQIAAQTEKPLESQRTDQLTQSVEARAKERLTEGTAASGVPKAPKLSKKLAAALEKETPPLSPQEKARLSAKSRLKAKRAIAQNPALKNDRLQSKPAARPSSTVVIDSSREPPLKRPEPTPTPAASITPAVKVPDCYGADRQSSRCRNRKN